MKIVPSTPKQRSMIGFLINRLGLEMEDKEDLIWVYTDERSTSIRDLSFSEAKQVIQSLTKGVVLPLTPAAKMRRKILSMAHELNWELDNGKIDMDRVNRWCIQYGYLGKPLDQYRTAELPALVFAFENMHRKHLEGI